ncbi:MAG: diguanylate cyclase [Spirochaetes bacterium]|nr:diguanylate cyclase [Spirochaetota bacterium]
MGKKFVAVYTGISLFLLLSILIVSLGRIVSFRRERLETYKTIHSSLRKMIEDGLSQEKSFHSPLLKSAIQQAFQRTPSLMLVIVYSFDEGIHYLRARNSTVLTTPLSELDALRGFPQFHYNSFTHVKITSSIALPPGTTYLLDAVYLLVDPSELIPILRDAIILILLLAGITLWIYFYGKRTIELSKATPRVEEQSKRIKEASETKQPEPESPPQNPSVETPPIDQCLFSPTTGLGWQQHLEKRLTLELERAAYNEQDLSLVLMQIAGMDRSNDSYRELAKSIQTSIAFEDLVFEYGEDGVAIVLPNSSLEQSITTLKGFLKKLDPSIPKQFNLPRCGVSSRNGRLIDGKQLILEAEGALKKAGSTWKDCIVGFRSDPGKYREFITKKEASQSIEEVVQASS